MMLESCLIKAIQILSRQTTIESIASSLLTIIHQNIKLAKSVFVIDKEYTTTETSFLIAVAENQTNHSNTEPLITFTSEFILNSHQEKVALSLYNYFRHQQDFSIITDKTKIDFDNNSTQQHTENFYCFPIVDEKRLLGILYLENIESANFISAITALITQSAIAINKTLKQQKQNEILQQNTLDLQQMSAVMEVAIDGISIIKEEKFVYLNHSYVNISGYDDPEELIGKNWRVLYPPEEITKIEKQAFPVFVQQGYWRGEYKAKRKDGTLFDKEIVLYRLNEGEMVCICRDISDRKIKEKQLKETKKQYSTLAATVPVGIFRTDRLGNFSYVNNRWCLITGLTPEEAMGKGWFRTIHPKDLRSVLQQWNEAIKTKSSFCAEYRYLTHNNIEVWVFEQAIAEYDNSGQLIGYIGTITDISQLKESQRYLSRQLQREQLLGQITQEIRRSWDISAISQTAANQIGKVFNVSRCLIHDYIFTSSPQIPILAQYTSDETVSTIDISIPVEDNHHALKIISQDLAVVSFDVKDDPLLSNIKDICTDFDIKSILGVRTSYQGTSNGIIALHQCGSIRQWTIDEVELLEAVAVQMGIAIAQARLLEKEQQQRQELYLNNLALTKAKQDAEVANQAKSQFLAHMSHELRTPLNAILGFSQIMARDDSLDKSQQEQIAIINRSGQHLLNLINNILDLSKIEAGKTTVREDNLNFYDFINAIEQMFQLQTQSKGLKLTVEINPEVPQFIVTDGVKLRQILINLLSNAIKFTSKGEVSLQVKSQNLHSLIFKITDTGAGIAKKDLDRMFEPFEQTHTGINSGEGTGLGLSICRSLIKLLEGMLEVESVVGLGTTFLFQIPIKIIEAEMVENYDTRKCISKIVDGQPPQRILIVDDNQDNCTLLNNLLTQIGFVVKEAYNGKKAIEIYRDWLPNLILMDIHMPIMNGYQATQQIKQLDRANHTKIIAATASILQQDKAKIRQIGCVDVISKPFNIDRLLLAIAKQLNVTYSYSDNCSMASLGTNNTKDNKLEQLELMPQEWLEKLHYATISASESQINHLIAQIPSVYENLAEEIKEMVNNFALEGIIDRVEYLLEINNEITI